MSDFMLSGVAFCIIAASAGFYLLEKKTTFGKLPAGSRQLLIGLFFGMLAVMATEFGVQINGAIMNVRDAAPLCAGLLFGAPAGIIAGIIGGAERYFAVYWGAGTFTRVACSVAAVLAGFFGAALRRFLFDDKKPSWYYALSVGLVTEVLHMLLIFLTNMDNVATAFSFVKRCTIPMMAANGLTVMLSVLAVSLLSGERRGHTNDQRKLSQTFQRWLLLCILIAFFVTSSFTFAVQDRLSVTNAVDLLRLNINDVRTSITTASDSNLLKLTRGVARELKAAGTVNNALLTAISAESGNDFSEINVVNSSGIITASTKEEYVGFDMNSGDQAREFMVLTDGKTKEVVQEYQPITRSANTSMKYAGVALSDGGFVQVGYDAERFQKDISSQMTGAAKDRHIGENGFLIIADENWKIVSDSKSYTSLNLALTGIWINTEKMPEGEVFNCEVYGEACTCMYRLSEGYYIVAAIPESEVVLSRDVSVYVMIFMEFCVFDAIFILVYYLIKKLVVENINKVNRALGEITGGNLNISVNVRGNEEFASLSDDINSTVLTLKKYIAEAAARIDKELEFARAIQISALPGTVPHITDQSAFDLHAEMFTAKEVGGDFYDYFPLDNGRLALVIADVSGKGIPASLFMMKSKTLIKSLAESGTLSPSQILTAANRKLCEGNEAEMFVTVWLGIYDINAGVLHCANAGHEYPAVRHRGGHYEYYRDRHGFVLAGCERSKYGEYDLPFGPGDSLFVYTDGVTESTDRQNRMFGEERLLDSLNQAPDSDPASTINWIKGRIDDFIGDAPQFDDITILCLRAKESKE